MDVRKTDDDRREELGELFDAADRDGDQRIDLAEFRTMMAGIDPGMEPHALDVGFHEIDTDHDNRIDFAEFLAWWEER
jgi:Ca2+-binding EF-hand superfamily protein